MKLVDILARELKVWPVDGCSIQQGIQGNLFTVQNGCLGMTVEKADDWLPAEVTRPEWQAAVDALKAAFPPEDATHHSEAIKDVYFEACWKEGEGGCWCSTPECPEWTFHECVDIPARAKLISKIDDYKPWSGEGLPPVGTHVCVHDDGSLVYGQGESGEVLAHVDGCAVIRMSYGLGCFLPRCLRTPEQIAAEERTKAIDDLVKVTCINRGEAAMIYDAGYRKQVAP